MTFSDWIAEPVNWVFLVVGAAMIGAGLRVVTARNVVHAALYLMAAAAASAVLFILLSAEFVALVVVLIYIGAVIVLFLFGIMITRAPTGFDTALDTTRKRLPALLISLVLFGVLSYGSLTAFASREIPQVGTASDTAILASSFLGRFVVPFEVVGFILLAALVGGITLARRDLTPLEEEERRAV